MEMKKNLVVWLCMLALTMGYFKGYCANGEANKTQLRRYVGASRGPGYNTKDYPVFAGIKKIPKPMETMILTDFKFGGDSAWWAFNFVANYITLKYSYMIEDLKKVQEKLEKKAYEAVYKIKPDDKVDITKFCEENTQEVIQAWWKLAADLVVKYNDGCITTVEGTGDKKVEKIMQKVDYLEWWLKQAGYYNEPTSYKKEEGYK